LAELGEFNFILGNGENLIVHAHTKLHALHRSCRTDGCRRDVILLATSPLTDEPWVQLSPSSIHVYASGREISAIAGPICGHVTRKSVLFSEDENVLVIQNGELQ
jgi:predicted glutamine amidotransferase